VELLVEQEGAVIDARSRWVLVRSLMAPWLAAVSEVVARRIRRVAMLLVALGGLASMLMFGTVLGCFAPAEAATDGTVKAKQEISQGVGGLAGPLDLGDLFGHAMGRIGDLDGDGVPDLAVGAERDDDGGTDTGAVWILFMNANGTVKAQQKISATTGGLVGLSPGSGFGNAVAGLGDLDGDGVPDLAVGAQVDDTGGFNLGAVYILFLNPNGTVKAQQKIADGVGGFAAGALDGGDQFGSSLATLGDLDGDAVTELAAGACFDDDGFSNAGAIWILFLHANGTVKARQKISQTQGGFGGAVVGVFGCTALAGIGDLDGDGVRDVVASEVQSQDGGGFGRGAVWILFLNTNGTVKAEQKISSTQGGFVGPLSDGDRFGYGIASAGDLDGDGVTDIAVGAIGDSDGGTVGVDAGPGAVWILFLNANGTVKAQQKISNTAGGFGGGLVDDDQFGTSLALVGDLDGDGAPELAVGSPQSQLASPFAPTGPGSAWIVFLNPGAGAVLSVSLGGSGGGTVTSDVPGILCGADCTESYNPGTTVTLTATPTADSLFGGWSGGGCVGTGTCVVTLGANAAITATFVRRFALTVSRAGSGSGTITSAPAGVSCGADCTEAYADGTVVTLTPEPASDSAFAGWGGDCTGAGVTTATMTQNRSCLATFDLVGSAQVTLIVGRAGTGSGSVTSDPPGIACGGDCAETYAINTLVALTAAPAAGSRFVGWSGGGCSGAGACVVTLTATTTLLATFEGGEGSSRLTVTRPANGRVVTIPPGIACPEVCDGLFPNGTTVTLLPFGLGAAFTGFSGNPDCADLVIVITGDITCTPGFDPIIVVSRDPATGTEANRPSRHPAVSGDGRLVAFESAASNLGCGTAGITQIYVRDRSQEPDRITCVSVDPAGQPGNNHSAEPAISADGRFVAFHSDATGLALGSGCDGNTHVFVRDLLLGATTCVSVAQNGVPGLGPSRRPALSRDATVVVFESSAVNLAPRCTTGVSQILRRHRGTGVLDCLSVGPAGAPGNGASERPAISADGTVVAFESSATSLAPGCSAAGVAIYLWAGAPPTCASVASNGTPANAASRRPDVSADGRFVAFESAATNLAPSCTVPNVFQIFVRDRGAGTTRCVSVGLGGVAGNASSLQPAINADGRVIVFVSAATNLVPAGGGSTTVPAGVLAQTRTDPGLFQADTVLDRVRELLSGGAGPTGEPDVTDDGAVTVAEQNDDVVAAAGGEDPPPPPPFEIRPVFITPLTGLEVSIEVPTTLTFSWTRVPNAVRYRLHLLPGSPLPPGSSDPLPDTTIPVSVGPGVPPGDYRVAVQGLSADGQSGPLSDPVTVRLGVGLGSTRPVLTSPASSALLTPGTPATFAWTPVPGASAYRFAVTGPLSGSVDLVGATRLDAIVPTTIPPGSYVLSITGLTGFGGAPVGVPSEPVTLVVQ
jgi:Tol biopolymer transport system component